MTIPFRSVAEAQAFASAFSKATASAEGSPRLSLNSTLHCLAVASKFKNWPAMKSHLEKQPEAFASPAKNFVELPPIGVMEVATLFRKGNEPRHYIYSSDSQRNRIQALAAAAQSAKSAGMDLITIAHDAATLEAVDLDHSPLLLKTSPSTLWKDDTPVSLGYCYELSRPDNGKRDPLGPFLSNLQELQKSRFDASQRADKKDVRSILLLVEPQSSMEALSSELKFSEEAVDEILRIAYWGRRLKISIGYLYDSSLDRLKPENSRLTDGLLNNSSSVHKD